MWWRGGLRWWWRGGLVLRPPRVLDAAAELSGAGPGGYACGVDAAALLLGRCVDVREEEHDEDEKGEPEPGHALPSGSKSLDVYLDWFYFYYYIA